MKLGKRDRNILWGWVDLNGNVKGGNCNFSVQRTAVGQYLITVNERLPQPCAILLTPIYTGSGTPMCITHSVFPNERQFKATIYNTVSNPYDNDFYWVAIGS